MPDSDNKRLARHYGLRGLLLGGFTIYIVHLAKSDGLQYYIAPRMMPYVKLAALALFVLAVYMIYEAMQLGFGWKEEADDCDCDHAPPRAPWRSIVLYVLFAAPLAFGFTLPDKAMGSDVVAVKGMNLSAAVSVGSPGKPLPAANVPGKGEGAGKKTETANEAVPSVSPQPSSVTDSDHQAEDAKLKKRFPTDAYNVDFARLGMALYKRDLIVVRAKGFLEMSTMLSMYADNFRGKRIEISGFVYRDPSLKADRFAVSRLVMNCCSAGAEPYGFLVESKAAKSLKDDTWVHVTGVIDKTRHDGNDIVRILATRIDTIKAPKDPYVYPFNDDILALAK